MSALTEFMLARIAEDEAVAQAASGGAWEARPYVDLDYYAERHKFMLLGPEMHEEEGLTCFGEADAIHISRHNPARVLAECEAKRQVLEFFADREVSVALSGNASAEVYAAESIERCLQMLAAVYADHSDYREEWRP